MGISNTEYILQSKLTEIVQFVKGNIDVIDDIFDDLDETTRQKIKDFWTDTEILVTIGYPRDAQSIPEYVILLNQEEENIKTIGDSESSVFLPTDTISVTGETLSTDDYIHYYTRFFPIADNYLIYRNGNLVDSPEYTVSTQNGKIEFFQKQSDTDTITIDYEYYPYYNQTGITYFTESYQIECWADNSEVVIWMFGVAKYFLLYYRYEFANQYGFMIQELYGKDIEPVTEYQPQFVYRRTLAFSTERANTWLKRYGILENIYVNNDPIRG